MKCTDIIKYLEQWAVFSIKGHFKVKPFLLFLFSPMASLLVAVQTTPSRPEPQHMTLLIPDRKHNPQERSLQRCCCDRGVTRCTDLHLHVKVCFWTEETLPASVCLCVCCLGKKAFDWPRPSGTPVGFVWPCQKVSAFINGSRTWGESGLDGGKL